jgi:hypothetical protein
MKLPPEPDPEVIAANRAATENAMRATVEDLWRAGACTTAEKDDLLRVVHRFAHMDVGPPRRKPLSEASARLLEERLARARLIEGGR